MTVYLVGAGPGDPDLLTLRAASLLARADVVVHDRLVDHRLLASASQWTELIDVGKRPGSSRNRQDVINDILIGCARRNTTVVRLKGGDPFVFGRGGEEAQALRAAGIDVEVVPGISSSMAAPATAGIPVTMRGISSGVTIVTAHQDSDTTEANPINWDALAHTGTTLVVLMGAARAHKISRRLIGAGMSPTTAAAVITRATCDDECVSRMPLFELGIKPVYNPSVIVIGDIAAYDVLRDEPAISALVSGLPSIDNEISIGTSQGKP